jgi:hypothetical protein
MWDCMHILVVKKDLDGNFTIISGNDRLEYLQKHTKFKSAPCIIDGYCLSAEIRNWFHRLIHTKEVSHSIMKEKVNKKSSSIVRTFLKVEPRFNELSPVQKMKVLLLAVRYKRTVITSMKTMVDELHEKK